MVARWMPVALLVLLVALLMAASIEYAPMLVPHPAKATDDGYVKAITDTRTALIQATIGLAALFSAVIGYLNLQHSRRSHMETLSLQERGQVTDRFTRAVDQLGSTNGDVRLGGVCALEQIAKDARNDHTLYWSVVSIWTAFVREHARWPKEGDTLWPETGRPTADIQAIMDALKRREPRLDQHPLDLSRTDLRAVDLSRVVLRNADLSYVSFRHADLVGADLSGSRLQFADLGGTNLDDAKLIDADLTHAQMNKDTSLRRTDLTGAKKDSLIVGGAPIHEAITSVTRVP